MPIEIDWEVSDAPQDGEDHVAARPGQWVRPAQPPQARKVPDANHPAPPEPGPGGRAAPGRRLGLLATLAVALTAAAFGVNQFTRAGWQQISADITALVNYEEQFSRDGQAEVVLRVQDHDNADWIALRTAQLEEQAAASPPIPLLSPADQPMTLETVELLDSDWARADVTRQYRTPDGQLLAFTLPQFYRRTPDQDWRRTAPPGGYWGNWVDWQAPLLHIRHSERDRAFAETVGPQLNGMLQAACGLWPDGCAGLAPVNLYLSGYVGSLAYDPLRNVKVLVQYADGGAVLPPDYFISVPSPQLAGMPTDAAGQRFLTDYLAVRAIAAMSREASGSRLGAQMLFNVAVSRLGLRHADPGYALSTPDMYTADASMTPAYKAAGSQPVLITRPLAVLAGQTPLQQVLVYTVQPGDTLSGISAQHGVPQSVLMRINGIQDADLIVAGSTLYIQLGAEE